ncbi:phosphotransferase family protein [Oligoflexus tunisiensis]|uniref:phosphotransferase family protein n=1 Tax=Oligoflexus tunisiensis TaxID=708132 RepID=UPI001FDEB89A|nr:aminoglycoside 3'-phosphotransferase/choline kinase family protein [Oligoflexus tunisiensis]
MYFPSAIDPDDFDRRYRLQSELWREPFLALWREKGPDPALAARFQPFTDGTNLIAALGEAWIMKVFPPFLKHQWVSEWRVMQHLAGQLQLPIPQYYASGVQGDWPYIIMSRLPGVTLENVWPRLGNLAKAALLQDIGRIMSRVHAVPVGHLMDLPPAWTPFFAQQIAHARARHTRLGMPRWFTDSVDAFVQKALPLLSGSFQPVILTGEYTPFNLLVLDEPEVTRIAGMIDFGDAMIGTPEYDLLGPLLFSCEGRPNLVKALLSGYGYAEADQNRTLRRRLMLLQILHRYSDFRAQLRIPGGLDRVHSIEELEELIWPLP